MRHRRNSVLIGLSVIALAVCGCAIERMYEGPVRPDSELAILITDSVESIDGLFGPFARELRLEPGTYDIRVGFRSPGPAGQVQSASTVLRRSLEKGKRYEVDWTMGGGTRGYGARFQIKEVSE